MSNDWNDWNKRSRGEAGNPFERWLNNPGLMQRRGFGILGKQIDRTFKVFIIVAVIGLALSLVLAISQAPASGGKFPIMDVVVGAVLTLVGNSKRKSPSLIPRILGWAAFIFGILCFIDIPRVMFLG